MNVIKKYQFNKYKPIIITEIWGKKKLGYYIDKQKYGTYILIQFKSDGTKNNNFNIQMEHNPSILAYMTVKIEEDGIREQTEDLDTQIVGKETNTSPEPVSEEISPSKEESATSVEETPIEVIGNNEKQIAEETPVKIEIESEEKVEE